MCTVILSPGDNRTAVNKYTSFTIQTHNGTFNVKKEEIGLGHHGPSLCGLSKGQNNTFKVTLICT